MDISHLCTKIRFVQLETKTTQCLHSPMSIGPIFPNIVFQGHCLVNLFHMNSWKRAKHSNCKPLSKTCDVYGLHNFVLIEICGLRCFPFKTPLARCFANVSTGWSPSQLMYCEGSSHRVASSSCPLNIPLVPHGMELMEL